MLSECTWHGWMAQSCEQGTKASALTSGSLPSLCFRAETHKSWVLSNAGILMKQSWVWGAGGRRRIARIR